MWKFTPAPRSAQTTIPCSCCSAPLEARRSCHEVTLYCPSCKRTFPVQDYIKKMDEALENFLEALQCNRI